jgi:hypothetical protein
MVAVPDLGAKLVRRIDRGIHVSPQPLLRRYQGGRDEVERNVSDDEEVDVAVTAQLPACGRAKDEGHSDLVSERRQRLAQHVDETCGLEKQGLELREDRGVAVRLEMNLSSLHRPAEQAGACERLEFLLHGSLGGAGLPDDLAKVERPLGMAEQQAEHPAASLAEKHVRWFDRPSWLL